jgi:DNA-binding response OmpR family regulator
MENKRILIIEDEVFYENALSNRLRKEGYEVTGVHSSRDGLDLALKTKPHLIVLDIIMPGMNGMAVLKQIRESGDWGKSVIVFMITNVPSESGQINEQVTELMPTYYIEKSDTTIQEIVDLVHKSKKEENK